MKFKNKALPDFEFEDAFLRNKAVEQVIPKLEDPNRAIQENALLCLS
jgi:hypothetical protein